MFKYILTFLGLYYIDASLITLYFVVPGIIHHAKFEIEKTILTCLN